MHLTNQIHMNFLARLPPYPSFLSARLYYNILFSSLVPTQGWWSTCYRTGFRESGAVELKCFENSYATRNIERATIADVLRLDHQAVLMSPFVFSFRGSKLPVGVASGMFSAFLPILVFYLQFLL